MDKEPRQEWKIKLFETTAVIAVGGTRLLSPAGERGRIVEIMDSEGETHLVQDDWFTPEGLLTLLNGDGKPRQVILTIQPRVVSARVEPLEQLALFREIVP